MRILVTGSRSWADRDTIYGALNDVVTEHGLWLKPDEYGNSLPSRDVVVVHGGAHGADRIAGAWAIANGLKVEVHPADWDRHGKSAGLIRNQEMVDAGADVALAFVTRCSLKGCAQFRPHGSHGAMHCASLAQGAGIPTRIITGGAEVAKCCDLHNSHCEPPSELCCRECTEANHPVHPVGVRCTWLGSDATAGSATGRTVKAGGQ